MIKLDINKIQGVVTLSDDALIDAISSGLATIILSEIEVENGEFADMVGQVTAYDGDEALAFFSFGCFLKNENGIIADRKEPFVKSSLIETSLAVALDYATSVILQAVATGEAAKTIRWIGKVRKHKVIPSEGQAI